MNYQAKATKYCWVLEIKRQKSPKQIHGCKDSCRFLKKKNNYKINCKLSLSDVFFLLEKDGFTIKTFTNEQFGMKILSILGKVVVKLGG